MTARYLGSMSIGDALPGAVAVAAAGAAGINAALPTLLSQRASLLAYQPAAIDFGAQLAQLGAMMDALKASMALGLTPPSLAGQLAAIADLLAALQAAIAGIDANLSMITAFQAALGGAGVHAIAYEGTLANLGSEVGAIAATVPASPVDTAHAITLLTTVPGTWAALAAIMGVTP